MYFQIMRNELLTAVFLLIGITAFAQNTAHLDGVIDLSIEERSIEGVYEISELPTGDNTLFFALNKQLGVDAIHMNDVRIASAKVPQDNKDYYVYKLIVENPFATGDKLKIAVSGKLKKFKEGKKRELRSSQIFINEGILRAYGDSKWYPVIVDNIDITEEVAFTYNFKTSCSDCSNTLLNGSITSETQGDFHSAKAGKDVVLIAGNYETTKGKYASYVNLPAADVSKLETLIGSISNFYNELTGEQTPENLVYAYLPTDVNHELVSGSTLIRTSQNTNYQDLAAFLSHEIAGQYLNNLAGKQTASREYYDRSLAKYLSLKYLKASQPEHFALISNTYNQAVVDANASLENRTLNPYQLLALEQNIGSDKMAEFLKVFYNNLDDTANAYDTLMASMDQVGVEQERIANIEKNIINNFDNAEETVAGF